MKKTVEEKFILNIYEKAKESGDPYSEVDLFLIAQKMNFHPKKIANLVKMLSRSGFLKKISQETVKLSSKV